MSMISANTSECKDHSVELLNLLDSLSASTLVRVVLYTQLQSIRLRYLRFDSIRANRHESFPLLWSRYTGSRFARDLENIASRVFERIDTNRKVP